MSRNVQKVFGTTATVKQPDTVNREGFKAYTKDVKESYVQMLMTNTLGNVFYTSKEDLLNESKYLHKKVTTENPEFAAVALEYARNEGFMRTQPIFGLVHLASNRSLSKARFIRAFNSVIKTPNDLIDFVTMLKAVRGNEGGRRVKDAVKCWLATNLSEYWVIKYGADKSGSYSLADLIKIYHPSFGTNDAKVAYLLGKEACFQDNSQILWYDLLKKATTDEARIKAIKSGRLPHEVASTFAGGSKLVWKAIADEMPTFALLRNLVNLERRDLIGNLLPIIHNKLTNKEILTKAKIMPFQIYSAFEKIATPEIKDILRIGIENTFDNLPDLGSKVAICLDHSGSMQGKFLTVASIFAIALAKKTGFNSKFYIFNTMAQEIKISKVDSILSQAEKIFVGGGTNTAVAVENMINDRVNVDTLIMITDEQQNVGTPFYQMVEKYKAIMHKPDLKVYIIAVAPYALSALSPKDMKNYYYIYGWSDKILDFISMTQKGFSSISKVIESKVNEL